MYRADGNKVSTKDAMYEIVPYIMPKRFDASNSIKVDIDLEKIQEYSRKCRARGVKMSHMAILIAAYLRLVSQNPLLNRFAMNKKIYARNHFCVCFVTLKPDNDTDTVTKVYFDLDDDIFTVNSRIEEAIAKVQNIASAIETLKELGLWIFTADADGTAPEPDGDGLMRTTMGEISSEFRILAITVPQDTNTPRAALIQFHNADDPILVHEGDLVRVDRLGGKNGRAQASLRRVKRPGAASDLEEQLRKFVFYVNVKHIEPSFIEVYHNKKRPDETIRLNW